MVAGVLIWQERTEDAVVVHVFGHVAAEVNVPTAIEQGDSLERVEHRLVDVRAETDAGFEVDFAVEIAVEVDAGDAAGPEVDFVVGLVVEVDTAAGPEIDFVVGLVVEVDAGDDAEFGLEESEFEESVLVVGTLMKIVLSKFVLGAEDAQPQHTWTDSQ